MRLFKTVRGFIFSFGFNMQERKPDQYYIGWCDPETLSWEVAATNEAGWIRTPFIVAPQFIKELRGDVLMFQSGLLVVLHRVAPPMIWTYTPYTPDQWDSLQAT